MARCRILHAEIAVLISTGTNLNPDLQDIQDMREKGEKSEIEGINIPEPEESEPSQADDFSATSSNKTTF